MMIRIKNGSFEKGLRGDIPPKILALKKWEQVSDYPQDAGYAIKTYEHFNYLPLNSWDMPRLGAIQIDPDPSNPVDIFAPWNRPASHFLDMGGTSQNSSIYQEVKHLDDEQPLTISFDYFDLAKYYGLEEGDDSFYGASTLKVYWNNKQVAEISGDNSDGWAHIDIDVMAGPNGEGEFKIYEKGTADDGAGIAIDNVSIEPRHDPDLYDDYEWAEAYGSEEGIDALSIPFPGEEFMHGENLVRNGSFERFKGRVEEGEYASLNKIPGWMPAERGAKDQFEIHEESIGDSAPGSQTTDGDYYLDTGLTPGNMEIKQSIKDLSYGDQIEISIDYFDHAMEEGKDVESSRLEVWWDDTYLGRIDGGNPDNWSTWNYRMTVHSDSAKNANQLILKEVGTNDNVGLGIDNIQVQKLWSYDDYFTSVAVVAEVDEAEVVEAHAILSSEEEQQIIDSQSEVDLAVA